MIPLAPLSGPSRYRLSTQRHERGPHGGHHPVLQLGRNPVAEPALRKHFPWTDQTGSLTTVFYNAYDTTPNVTDTSRYPIFLPGKGPRRSLCRTEGPFKRLAERCFARHQTPRQTDEPALIYPRKLQTFARQMNRSWLILVVEGLRLRGFAGCDSETLVAPRVAMDSIFPACCTGLQNGEREGAAAQGALFRVLAACPCANPAIFAIGPNQPGDALRVA
jgi:hypothetical protein